jgi:hypothetical protein
MRKILESWSMSETPGNKFSLSISSPRIQPADHMSTAGPYSLAPKRSSGARYYLVVTFVECSLDGVPKLLVIPKSISLT